MPVVGIVGVLVTLEAILILDPWSLILDPWSLILIHDPCQVLMPVVGMVGVLGNFGAILILMRPEMRSTFHHSLLTLAIVDVIFVVTLIVDTQVNQGSCQEWELEDHTHLPAFVWLLTKQCSDGTWTSTTSFSSCSSRMCGTPSKIYSWLSKHFSWWVFYNQVNTWQNEAVYKILSTGNW